MILSLRLLGCSHSWAVTYQNGLFTLTQWYTGSYYARRLEWSVIGRCAMPRVMEARPRLQRNCTCGGQAFDSGLGDQASRSS